MSASEHIFPVCAVCRKRVECVDVHRVSAGTYVYTVHCHGERETTKLTLAEMSSMSGLEPGIAFAPKGLPQPERKLPRELTDPHDSPPTGRLD